MRSLLVQEQARGFRYVISIITHDDVSNAANVMQRETTALKITMTKVRQMEVLTRTQKGRRAETRRPKR